MGIFGRLFPDKNERELKKIEKIFRYTGSVATSVLPSPVLISAILP
mgnify:CR=1 FL=1